MVEMITLGKFQNESGLMLLGDPCRMPLVKEPCTKGQWGSYFIQGPYQDFKRRVHWMVAVHHEHLARVVEEEEGDMEDLWIPITGHELIINSAKALISDYACFINSDLTSEDRGLAASWPVPMMGKNYSMCCALAYSQKMGGVWSKGVVCQPGHAIGPFTAFRMEGVDGLSAAFRLKFIEERKA